MNVALLTYFDEKYKPLADVALPNFDRYCKRHGYHLFQAPYHTDASDLKTYGDRGKIEMFNQVYDAFDIAMFLDIDALIMNHHIRIEETLGADPFLWTYDVNGPCSGFWIARCIPPVHLMLNTVRNRAVEAGSLIARENVGPPHTVTLQMEPHGTSDQTMMRSLMNTPPYSLVLQNCVPGKTAGHCYPYGELAWPPTYNYLGNYEPGDWLITFPSLPLERRLELMKHYAQDAH